MVLPCSQLLNRKEGLCVKLGLIWRVSLLRSAWSLLWTLPLYWQVMDHVTFEMRRGGHWQASWMLVYVKVREALGMTVFYTTVTPFFSKRKGCYCPRDLWSFEVQRLQIPICQAFAVESSSATLQQNAPLCTRALPFQSMPPNEQAIPFSNVPGKHRILECSPSLWCIMPSSLPFEPWSPSSQVRSEILEPPLVPSRPKLTTKCSSMVDG